MNKPVGLAAIKSEKFLENIPLVKQPRLSVTPLTQKQFERILMLAETAIGS